MTCVFFRSERLVPAARSCIVQQALGAPCALCPDCVGAAVGMQLRAPRVVLPRDWLFACVALLALLIGCGGESVHDAPPAPAPACEVQAWTEDYCELIPASQHVVICEGRPRGELEPTGVWSGAPEPACRPADGPVGAEDPSAWCSW